jgi:hypothetical protein
MTLAYAVRMIVEAEGGGPTSLRMIADHVGRWARIPDPMIETTQKGLKGSLVTTEVLGDPDDPPWAWRLSFSHPDETYPNVRWGVRVTAVTAATSVVSVRLDRTRTDGVVARDRTEPAPPGCIPALIGAAGLSVVDGGRCLESSVWVVESDQEQDLADLVMAEDRRLPIFVFTPRDEEVIDGGEFQRSVMGLAHVVLLRPEVSWRLGEILPRGFNVYGGSARIWWPEVTADSSRWDHPLWTSDRPAHLVVRQARSSILEAGLTAAVIDRRVIELEQAKRVESARVQGEEIEALLGDQAAISTMLEGILDDGGQPDDSGPTPTLGGLISRVLRQRDADINDALSLAAMFDGEAGDERERASDLAKKVVYLEGEVDRLRSASGQSTPMADRDADRILCDEILREAMDRHTVDGFSLRSFTIGASFAESLEAHGGQYRSKAIRVCGDIVSGAPSLIGRRDDHPLRTGEAGSASVRLRSSDDAEARRCKIEEQVPAARRLHYWLLSDGSIELASINLHEDMSIPG